MPKPLALVMVSRRSHAPAAAERHCALVFWQDVRDDPGFFAATARHVRAVVTAGSVPLPEDLLARLPAVGIIAYFGAGYDTADLPAWRGRGIAVTYVPATNHEDVADVAIGLAIAAVRRLSEADRVVRSGAWSGALPMSATPSLRALRFGILGLGAIGKAVAARLEPFGGTIRWWGPRPQPDARWDRAETLHALARDCDVLIVAARADQTTRGLVDAAVIAALGPTGYLVNVSRGFVVDEEALVAALRSGQLAGAGLDVFDPEPTDPARWRDLPNVALAPHIGGFARAGLEASQDILSENLRRHFAGEALLTPVPA